MTKERLASPPSVDSFGVYIHVPFCHKKCDYCAFATWADKHSLVDDYMAALRADIGRAVDRGLPIVDTVFVGGGTPTTVDADALASCIEVLPLARGAEVTVECNPDDVTLALMQRYSQAGVNRISMGVQSMRPSVLSALGRTHDVEHVNEAVKAVRAAGIEGLNLDLIYGAHGETLDDWSATLHEAVELSPTHISAYALTVEAGTPLSLDASRHPDDDDLADKYLIAEDVLTAAGLANYEISNWSIPGFECRHNMIYWRQGDYLGFGCAAHSHEKGRRWWNLRTPERYIHAVHAGESTEAAGETLDDGTRRRERLELLLRMRDGIEARHVPVTDLNGLVEVHDGMARLTVQGRLLANEVSLKIIP